MRAIWLVIKHDVVTTLRQRSFWVLTLLMPALLLALNAYSVAQSGGVGDTGSEEAEEESGLADFPKIGLVDEGGVIAALPPGIPKELFERYPEKNSALAALEAGDVRQVLYVAPNYLNSGEVVVYDQNFQILSGGENMGLAFNSANEWVLRYLINANLVPDEAAVALLEDPLPGDSLQYNMLAPPEETTADQQALAEVVASVVPYIYYFLLLLGSSYLMRSVVAEKENRTAEVLLLCLNPRQLMVGKILAMSVVVLVQLVFWVGGGSWILGRGAEMFNVANFSFAPSFFVWATLFLILGYLLFASLMAAAGALAPNAREGGQMTWLLVIPLMPTLMFGNLFLEQPNHPLIIGLSLFPFSAPSAMVTRLAVGEVPLWQILISAAGLGITTYLFVVLAGRFFQAGNLLSDTPFSWRRLATGWRK